MVSGLAQTCRIAVFGNNWHSEGTYENAFTQYSKSIGATDSEKIAMVDYFKNVVSFNAVEQELEAGEKPKFFSSGKLLITSEYAVIDGAVPLPYQPNWGKA